LNSEVYQYTCSIGHKHGCGTYTCCSHFKIIPFKSVKWIYSLNKFNIDSNKCSINFLDIQIIKQKCSILLEEVLEFSARVVIGKVNLVPTIQIHQNGSKLQLEVAYIE
jgi:hypothetical protein